ncbi:MAG: hypothetical protein ACTSVY_06520 [Candidatus Helarchaeota archaeon]
MSKIKNVQTTISEKTYNKLVKVARKNNISIKQVLREAIELWIDLKSSINPKDPIFNLTPISYGSKDVSEKIDSILYGDDD